MTITTQTSPNAFLAPSGWTFPGARCAGASDPLVLADGTRLRFRPVTGADRAGLADLFARLSSESRRMRFLSPKGELTSRELTFLTDIDHVGHEAIAAVGQQDGSLVGVGRYVSVADRARVAEVAFEVEDDRQNMGVGTALANHVVRRARANGFTLLTATTLSENLPARALVRRLGFRAPARPGRELELELDLRPGEWRVCR
jgi:protein lysine acetyltransferase